jgi:hypothetical protein
MHPVKNANKYEENHKEKFLFFVWLHKRNIEKKVWNVLCENHKGNHGEG